MPTNLSALYIYGKQGANAAQQIIGFSRRVSYPDVIKHMVMNRAVSVFEVLRMQKYSLYVAFLFILGMSAASALTLEAFPESSRDIGYALAIVAPTLIGAAIFSAIGQAYYARGSFRALSIAATAVLIASLALAAILEPYLGIYGFIVAEVLAHVLGVIMLVRSMRR